MSPMPPPGIGGVAGLSSGFLHTRTSLVSVRSGIEEASEESVEARGKGGLPVGTKPGTVLG